MFEREEGENCWFSGHCIYIIMDFGHLSIFEECLLYILSSKAKLDTGELKKEKNEKKKKRLLMRLGNYLADAC